jgi:IS30 family transposase
VGTAALRKTSFVILSKMQGCTARAALESFIRQMKHLPVALRRSMTCDRGSELACHPDLTRRLKIDIWFCDPHAPWQRGPTALCVLSEPLFIETRVRAKREAAGSDSNQTQSALTKTPTDCSRRFFPKGSDLSDLSQTALNDVARLMNNRPRKTLGWNTPAEAMAEERAAIRSTVALQT